MDTELTLQLLANFALISVLFWLAGKLFASVKTEGEAKLMALGMHVVALICFFIVVVIGVTALVWSI